MDVRYYFNKSFTVGCWISPLLYFIFCYHSAAMNKYCREKWPIYFVALPISVESISLTLNLGLIFWIALPNRDSSKCDANRGLESVHVLGLAPFFCCWESWRHHMKKPGLAYWKRDHINTGSRHPSWGPNRQMKPFS